MTEEDVINEIRLQTAILKAAFRSQLDALAAEVRADEISRTILELLENGAMAAGTIRSSVIEKVKGSRRKDHHSASRESSRGRGLASVW